MHAEYILFQSNAGSVDQDQCLKVYKMTTQQRSPGKIHARIFLNEILLWNNIERRRWKEEEEEDEEEWRRRRQQETEEGDPAKVGHFLYRKICTKSPPWARHFVKGGR